MVLFRSRGRDALRPGLVAGAVCAALAFAAPALAASPDIEPDCRAKAALTRHEGELASIAQDWRRGRPLRIVAIGSSSTEGVGASAPGLAYPARLGSHLSDELTGWSVTVANLGIGGETAEATVERLRAVVATHPSLVLWQVGTNDALKGGDPAAFRRLVERGVAAARAADVGLVIIDPQDFQGIKDRETYDRYVDVIRSVADDNEVPLFSRYALMREWRLTAPETLASMLSKDGFHLGDRGYECLAQHLSAMIVSAVRRRRDAPAPAVAARERPVTAAGIRRPQ